MSYSTWPRWTNLTKAVPTVPAPPSRSNMTLRYAEAMRAHVWAQPYNVRKGATDWDPLSRGYPADPTGCCRHKVAWLHRYLGGVPVYGRRTDKGADPEMHCVLWLRIGGYGFILDHDGIWPERSAPFIADGSHKAYST